MSHVAIAKVHEAEREAPSLLAELKSVADRIRERAFNIFQRRGSGDGMALDDWLEAERDLVLPTESDLTEKDSKFQLHVAVAGFAEKDLKVTALPDALVVQAESSHRHEKNEGSVHFCEFGEKMLSRRFYLPEEIDVDKVTAQLDKGILCVTAPKAKQANMAITTAA